MEGFVNDDFVAGETGAYLCLIAGALSSIGGAIFSAGAVGNAGAAPVVCPPASRCAGTGAGVVGRAPPGFDSAGASL
jgi:hypothetical protein